MVLYTLDGIPEQKRGLMSCVLCIQALVSPSRSFFIATTSRKDEICILTSYSLAQVLYQSRVAFKAQKVFAAGTDEIKREAHL